MSWDVYIVIDTGGPEPATICEVGNMTYNVSPMYFKAFGTGEGFRGLNGMVCAQARPLIDAAMAYMRDRAAEMSAMEPLNGWGDSPSAYLFLGKLRDACEMHPKASVRIS